MLELKRLIKALSVSEQGVSKHAVSKHAVSEPAPLDPQFLCTIVSIVSLNVLARNNSIKNLSANATSDLSSLNHDEIYALAKTLHVRAQALAPHSVRNVMPLPMPLTASQWSALKQFFKATKDLPLLANEIAIGHAYQLCSQLRRKEALKQVQSSNKEMNVDALISFTQLYTPQWVVDTLIAQTLPACKPSIARLPTELNIIDPACGAGNFLLPAFEAVLKICCAEGISESDAVEHMSRGGLSGVDIDPYGIWITSLALTTRCLRLKAPMAISFKGIQLLEINDSEESILGTLVRINETARKIQLPDSRFNSSSCHQQLFLLIEYQRSNRSSRIQKEIETTGQAFERIVLTVKDSFSAATRAKPIMEGRRNP